MGKKDPRKAAEAFINKVIAPIRQRQSSDLKVDRARVELARKNADFALAELAKGGLDPERLDALAAKRSKEGLKLAEQAHRSAVKASAAAASRLRGLRPIILPIDPIDTLIDQVTFIRSFAGQGVVKESNIAPGDNWARYRVDSTDDAYDGTGRLSFFTLWQNRQDSSTIVSAKASLVVNAQLSCDAEWNGVASWFGFSSDARGTVRARTTVWGMDSSVSSIVQDQLLGSVGVSGDFFGDDSSKSIEFTELLPATGVSVPPQTYILIEVELLTEWHANFGSVSFDAESGSHRVDVPQLVLTEIRSPPPISLSASVSYATSPATVTLTWSGATTNRVDVYLNGVKIGGTPNNGSYATKVNPATYLFWICETGSTVCSPQVSVTVTH